MKRSIFLIIVMAMTIMGAFSAYAQTSGDASEHKTFGAEFSPEGAIPASKVENSVKGETKVPMKIEGIIKEVCQAKGCWAKIDAGNGKEIMVRFKNYGFFLPKDAAGKTVVLNGAAFEKETSVAQLRHYAEDAGKSKKEIARIRKAQKSLQFEADGVILKD